MFSTITALVPPIKYFCYLSLVAVVFVFDVVVNLFLFPLGVIESPDKKTKTVDYKLLKINLKFKNQNGTIVPTQRNSPVSQDENHFLGDKLFFFFDFANFFLLKIL